MEYNIKNYGAVGDSITKDTAAIQAAVDAASAAGGGKVVLPPGRYLSGKITLRDNIIFEMMPGAEIFASLDVSDYPLNLGSSNSRYRTEAGEDFKDQHLALLYCYNAKNIIIRGGHLLTDDLAFFTQIHDPKQEHYEGAIQAEAWFYYKPILPRPFMILLEDSQDITIEDVTISNYPCYAGWLLGCNNVTLRSIKTRAKYEAINADGFHFSSCRNVFITDSHFICGDDCIAIDGNHNGISQDYVITNCIFDTSVHAFRIYTGLDPFMRETKIPSVVRNVTISNCAVTNAAGVFDINGHHGDVSNITAINIVADLEREGTPILVSTQNGTVHNVRISNLTVNGNGTCMIWAEKPGQITGIRLYDSDFTVTPKTKINAQPQLVPEYFPNHCHFRPNHFYFENARDVIVRGITLKWNAPIYSDTWTQKRLETLKKNAPGTDISLMEPKHLEAFELVNCENIRMENNDTPAFDA